MNNLFDKFLKGFRCKACKQQITEENAHDHWYFKCNPEYKPELIEFPFTITEKDRVKE